MARSAGGHTVAGEPTNNCEADELSDIKRIFGVVADYEARYRHPDLAAFEVSEIYYLSAQHPKTESTKNVWPSPFPQVSCAGVYAIFDSRLRLLYIGKTVNFGSRLSQYFKYAPNKTCNVIGDWGHESPESLITIAVSEPFEASSFEEYLIGRLDPPLNRIKTSPNVQ